MGINFAKRLGLHQQVFACVVAAQNDIVDLANVHELGATGVADGALGVLLHLDQGVGQIAFDGSKMRLPSTCLYSPLLKSEAEP